jgi:hypothetical protein
MLDEKGAAELAAELSKLSERVQKVFDASARRMGTPDDGAAPPETTVVMMAFDSSEQLAKKPARAKR